MYQNTKKNKHCSPKTKEVLINVFESYIHCISMFETRLRTETMSSQEQSNFVTESNQSLSERDLSLKFLRLPP